MRLHVVGPEETRVVLHRLQCDECVAAAHLSDHRSGGTLDGFPGGTVSDYMTSPAESIGPTARLYDIVHIFLTRSYRKLPVVAESHKDL